MTSESDDRVEGGVGLDGESLAAGDLVIFEGRDGGRCVRVQTGCPHHVCVVMLHSDQSLHCNLEREGPCVPGTVLLRLVPYARLGIDSFAAAVAREPGLWNEVKPQLDVRLRERAEAAASMPPPPHGTCMCS